MQAASSKMDPPSPAGSAPIYPTLIAGLRTWPLFPSRSGREATYIIGQPEINSYIVVPGQTIGVVERLLLYFDGNHSLEWIREHFFDREGRVVNVYRLYERLAEAGLLSSPSEVPRRISDIEAATLPLVDFPIPTIAAATQRRIKTLAGTAAWSSVPLVLSGLLIYIAGFLANGKITSPPAPVSAIAYSKAICAVLLFLSVVLHECSHGIAAIFFGLSVRHIRVALYLGFVPIVYLRINGLYTLRPRQRLAVWLAGPYANLVIASVITLVLYFHCVSIGYAGLLRIVLIGNFLLVLLNLFPFLPTDGYYIASTLLGAYNVRTNAWSKFAKLFNGKPAAAGQRIEIVYLVATLITISSLLIRRLMTGVHTGIGGAILTCISIGLFIFSLVTAQKTQRKPQSRVLSLTIRGLTVVSALCATRVDRLLMNHGGVHALMASILLRLHQQQARITIGAIALGCVATLSITYSRLLSSRIGERFFRATSAKHKL